MDWNGDGSRRAVGKDHDVMTADNPICRKPGARQGSNDATPVQGGQLSVGHA